MIPSSGEDGEQMEFSCVAGGSADGTSALENSLAVSYKGKCTLLI